MDDAEPMVLMPGGQSYSRELSLRRVAAGRTAAVWIDTRAAGERILCRTVAGEEAGDIQSVDPLAGDPIFPDACGPLALWCEMRDRRGTLVWAAPGSGPAVVEQMAADCGEFACAADGDAVWVLAEDWQDGGLRLARWEQGQWEDKGAVGEGRGLHIRPRLCRGPDSLMAAWDEHDGPCYRTMTAEIAVSGGPVLRALPTRPDHRDTLPAPARGGDGAWYAARCRDQAVEIDDGVVTFHSELIVSVLDGGVWRDAAAVDIDHGLNPWEGAYVGLRRFPRLVPGRTGVWLLWEEKEDPLMPRESVGRLCAVMIGPSGAQTDPLVAHRGRAMYVVERDGPADDLLVATKKQTREPEQHLPWLLHRIDLTGDLPPRPADVRSNRDAPKVAARPRPQQRAALDDAGLNLYFGDPHLHSRLSQDLEGEPDELYHFARDVAGLDFAAITDNDFHWLVEPLSPAAWQWSMRCANAFYEPGRFTTMVGWEYTKHASPDGGDNGVNSHRCVLFPGDEGEVYTWHDDLTPTPQALVAKLAGRRVLLHHHHPMGYDVSDDSLERNIEVCSGWWNCMMKPQFVEELHRMLREGRRLGFFGGSDNHERNPGLGGALTGAWAAENTREGIFDAFERRRVFATTGLRPDLRFRVAGGFMGGEAQCDGAPLVELSVACARAVRMVEIVRDGEVVHSAELSDSAVNMEWRDEACPPGAHWWYAHILFEGEEGAIPWNVAPAVGIHAWTSPVWVEVTA